MHELIKLRHLSYCRVFPSSFYYYFFFYFYVIIIFIGRVSSIASSSSSSFRNYAHKKKKEKKDDRIRDMNTEHKTVTTLWMIMTIIIIIYSRKPKSSIHGSCHVSSISTGHLAVLEWIFYAHNSVALGKFMQYKILSN